MHFKHDPESYCRLGYSQFWRFMLTIRAEQFEALAAARLARFQDQMVKYLEAAFPEQFPASPSDGPPGPAREFVRKGLHKALAYEITIERDVSDFIRLMVFFGPEFEESGPMAWSKRFLTDDFFPGDAKMKLILQDLTEGEHTDLLPEGWNHVN
jgi:hypothetical protein